ncbi:MAG: hypothetical protein KA763_05220 [Xanthomonadales bacterium]|nr:hypothetical protein [Xanthomonadales bacterium]
MPQLKSGRHVALSASPYLDALNSEKDESKYFAIIALRAHTNTPQALRDHLVIGYFVDGVGTPPDAPSYNTGYCVGDVLEGRTDWSPAEIEEFRHFFDEPRFSAWLQVQFDEIDEAIRNSPVWHSELLANDLNSDEIDVPMLKRAIVQKSALESDAMRQLRKGTKHSSEMDDRTERPVLLDVPTKQPEIVPESEPVPRRELPLLTPELRTVILNLARQPDIHSLSCPFKDYDLWYALIEEQIKRSEATGWPYQDAFCLCAPDTGIEGMQQYDDESEGWPFHPPPIGGYVHISYEGVCGGDLFIVPSWRKVWPGQGAQPQRISELVGKKCNYILSHRDLGIVDCATRTIVAGCWYLYKSNAPHEDCSPFRKDR